MNFENVFKNEKETLEQKKQEILKQYGLDDESIKEFRSKIDYTNLFFDYNYETLKDFIYNNDIKGVEKLIITGINVNKRIIIDERNGDFGILKPITFLECAIEEKNLDIAILLLKAGYKMNINDMSLALYSDMYELCKIMILMGIDLTKKIDTYETILDVARFSKQEKYIKLFENAIRGDYSIIFEEKIKKEHNPKKLSDFLKDAEKEMDEILKDVPFQKIKK